MLLGLCSGCSGKNEVPTNRDAASEASQQPTSVEKLATKTHAVAMGRDPHTRVPTLLKMSAPVRATDRRSARAAARSHLRREAFRYRVGERAVSGLEVAFQNQRAEGPVLVAYRQRLDGIEVLDSRTSVLMDQNLSLLAIGGAPKQVLDRTPSDFSLANDEAITIALSDQRGVAVEPHELSREVRDSGGFYRHSLETRASRPGGHFSLSAPARAKRVYVPTNGGLTPAHWVELFTEDSQETLAHRYLISSLDGSILIKSDLMAAAHTYRVWAHPEENLAPRQSPLSSVTPHPTSEPDGFVPSPIDSSLVTVEALNRNPAGNPDPWLPADASTTAGNNVEAYADLSAPDGFSAGDLRASTTSPGTFDHSYDLSLGPLANEEQSQAAVTQLFYITNWLHDWYYDSGFTESAGNAQLNNYGRGGAGGDVLVAQAQNGALDGALDNANMLTPSDGMSPRMQIFIWSAPRVVQLEFEPGGSAATGVAEFGPEQFAVEGPVVLVDDGAGNVTDACDGIIGDLAGQVALVDRGNCSFQEKVQVVQEAGAVAALIGNNVEGPPPAMGGESTSITIGSLSVSQADAEELKAALVNGNVSAALSSEVRPQRSGSLDSSIVAHEWGHYLQERLAPCGTSMCRAMSEGWGDYVALHLLLTQGEDPSLAYPIGSYGSRALGPDVYFGIRRLPYSTNFDVNPLTFRHLSDDVSLPSTVPIADSGMPNSEIHNAGEIWASMLFEAYAAVIESARAEGQDFEHARRAMTDYAVIGLSLMPPQPTFLEARDALLAAAEAGDPAHAMAMAQAFARRGAGSCAVSPPRDSTDFVGVVESFELAPDLSIETIEVVDSPSCTNDEDDALDVGEHGFVRVWLQNKGFAEALDVQVEVQAETDVAFFPDTASSELPSLPPLERGAVDIPVRLDDSTTQATPLPLSVDVRASEACEPELSASTGVWTHYDAASSTFDDVEVGDSVWTPEGSEGELIWQRELTPEPLDHFWRGRNASHVSDTTLVSPSIEVSANDSFSLSFSHSYQFESSQGENWDGAVVEISTDGGLSWEDALTESEDGPDYTGTISDLAQNPLGGRSAYTGENSAWPGETAETIDWGTQLAGETVQVRFRIGTDELVGEEGWRIDDISVQGVSNMPFRSLVSDTAEECVHEDPMTTGGTTGSGGSSFGVGSSPATGGSSGGTRAAGGDATGDSSGGRVSSADGTGGAATGGELGRGNAANSGVDDASPSDGRDGGSADAENGTNNEGGCGCSSPGNHAPPSRRMLVLFGALALLPVARRRAGSLPRSGLLGWAHGR